MSRKIDLSGNLSEADKRYLQVRGKLPKGVERVSMRDQATPKPLEEVPHTGTANTAGLTVEQLEAALEEARSAQTEQPKIEDDGGITEVEEDEEVLELSYDDMNNDQRRAELSSRGLSVGGNKDDLIARLRRSDSEQLEAEDYA